MKFADVKNDTAFRKIFGNENRKESLISFLNAVLEFEGEQKIVEVTILNPYQLPKLRGGKATIVDVKATDQAKRSYIVEMQVAELDGFHKRVLYYAAQSYSSQIKRGDFYRQLNPVIFIAIVDFNFTQNPNFINRSRVQDIETGENTVKDVEFTFIELPKFTKKEKELGTLTEKWVYFIKNAENLEVIPDNVDDLGLKSAYEEANQYTWTKEDLDAYDYDFMREEDARAAYDAALNNGFKKGLALAEKVKEEALAEGKAEGKAEGQEIALEQTVLKLHRKSKNISEIADLLDLAVEKVTQIITQSQK